MATQRIKFGASLREDRILIKPKAGIELALLDNFHAGQNVRPLRTFDGLGNFQILSVPAGSRIHDLISTYQRSGLVDFAEPDFQLRAAGTNPNDPFFLDGTLWALNNAGQNGGLANADIDAPEGWDTLTSASNIVVAVIDTGVRYSHEDLAANMWSNPIDGSHGLNTVTNAVTGLYDSGDPDDDHGHGTRVAGIIGAIGNNGKGVVGVAWRIQIMACKFLTSAGDGFISDAIACIDYARTNGAKIINASWGQEEFSASLSNAIEIARSAGIIVVTAAGNDGRNLDSDPFYPASFNLENILVVAATTRTDQLVSYSNFGAATVHLGAPGQDIYSTDFQSDNAYATDQGTSMAAACVSGACALVEARYPTETHQEIIHRLLNGTDPLPGLAGRSKTGGRINLAKALGPRVTAPLLNPILSMTDNSFRLLLFGEPGQPYTIQASTNLVSWTNVFTGLTSSDGTFVFTNQRRADGPGRFFRALYSP